MADAEEIIDVTGNDSEVIRLFEKALDHPVLLERDGVRVRLMREFVYDPESAREAMRSAGVLAGVDPDVFKAQIYLAREAGSREPSDP